MKESIINKVIVSMSNILSKNQLAMLVDTLSITLEDLEINKKKNELTTELVNNYEYLKNYLVVKKVAGVAESTLKMYQYMICKFLDRTKCNLIQCDTNTIRVYLLTLQKDISNTSVDNARRCLNCFFQFLEDEGFIPKNPCRKIPRIKDVDRIQKFWDDLAIETLRDSCINKRELALIDLLISTGLRISEVPKIKITDIDWEKRLILINGKGNKQRLVPFSIRAQKHLLEYINDRGGIGTSCFLFCRTRGPLNRQVTKAMIYDVFDTIRKRANIHSITIHGIRRWFASSLDRKGVDSNIIQDILGHESFSTTKKHYLNKKTVV